MSDSVKRVVHVVGDLNRGGIETLLMNLYRKFDRNKIQFDFVKHTEEITAYDEEVKSLGGRIFSVPRYTGKNHFKYKKAWGNLFKEHPEWRVIHGHVRSTANIYLKIAKKHSVVRIIHSHSTGNGSDLSAIIKNILQRMLRADYYFACSYLAGKWMFGEEICKNKKFFIFNNAIDVDLFAFDSLKRNQIRMELGVEDKFVIGNVGRLIKAKNHRFLIEIFAELCKSTNKAILLIAGDGELRSELEKLTEILGIKEKVIFFGMVSDISSVLSAMDLFVMPSIREGLPLAFIEAQASGLSYIVSEVIPREALIIDSGVVLSFSDSKKIWSDHIYNLLMNISARDKETSIMVKKAGFDIVAQADWLQNFYLEF